MKIEKVLQELGLTKNKGIVYIAALNTGKGSALDIAKRAGLPRTTTHEILQYLVSLGLISYILRGRKRVYSA